MQYFKRDNYFFVADFDPTFDLSNGGIIAVTPWAAYDLDKAGLEYDLMYDYSDVKDCVSNQDEYFIEQLNWFHRFDAFLKQEIPFFKQENLPLIVPHFSNFKWLIDTIIIRSFMIRRFFKKTKPKKICYIVEEEGLLQDNSIYSFNNRAMSIIKDIVVQACNENGVDIEVHQKSPSKEVKRKVSRSVLKRVLDKRAFVEKIKSAKNLIYYEKYKKVVCSEKAFQDVSILFLDAGTKSIDLVIKNFINKGAKVFVKNQHGIFLISNFYEKKVCDYEISIDEKIVSEIKNSCLEALDKFFNNTSLVEWIDKKANLKTLDIFRSYFEDFFKNTCPEFFIEAKNMRSFFEKEKIDIVIARASTGGKNYPSVLSVANNMQSVRTVCFQHSCTILDLPNWFLEDLHPFDYYFTNDSLSESYFRHHVNYPYIKKCEVLQAPHYLKDIVGVKRGVKKNTKNKETVIYLTKKFTDGMLRFNTFVYPITWYFEFQKKIVEFFEQRQDFNFIYKDSVGQDWAEKSIHLFIKEKNLNNVFVAKKPFVEYINVADRVIMDYPSTAFFEASAASLPVMAFYWDVFKEWGPSVEYFDKSLNRFRTAEEAIDKINTFLDDSPENYIKALPYSDGDMMKQLFEIKKLKDMELTK